MATRSLPRAQRPAPDRSGIIGHLDEASLVTDYLRGLYSIKYQIVNTRDCVDGESLDWFTDFHIGVIDGAIDAAAAHVGRLILEAKKALQAEGA